MGEGKREYGRVTCGIAAGETSGSQLYLSNPLELQWVRWWEKILDKYALTLRNGKEGDK